MMNVSDYFWQLVKVNGKLKAMVYDIRNDTKIYLSETTIEQMAKDLTDVKTGIAIVKEEEN